MTTEDPRTLLAQADRERRTAEACDALMAVHRLGTQTVVRRGVFGWRRTGARAADEIHYLTADQSAALYRAAGIVKREAQQHAKELEARVTTVDPRATAREDGGDRG